MTQTSPTPTNKGHLTKKKRISIPIRLLVEEHTQLHQDALADDRSMSFIALRRYRKGLAVELAETKKN